MITPLISVDSSTFTALLNENEMLQIKGPNVSIISTRSGFCSYFYYLPHQPRQFSISSAFPERYALIYPASKERSEMIVVLETYTGKVLRAIQMKNGMFITRVSIGTHLIFQETTNMSRVYFSNPTQNETVSYYDLKSKSIVIAANKSVPQFVTYTESNLLVVVTLQPDVKVTASIPYQERFTFIHFKGSAITIGLSDGRLQIINTENNSTKTVDTPHRTKPIYYSQGIAVTRDGTAFALDTGETFLTHFRAESVSRGGSTIAIIGKTQTKIYEFIKKPICSCLQFQPPEPFTSSSFVIEDLILFASGSHIYSFDMTNISKFATLYNAKTIIKILNSAALITVVYISNEGTKRIQTLVAGANNRDEEGIDAATDTQKQTWILEKNRIVSYRKNLLSIEEVKTIDLPEDHHYDSIFRMRDSVCLYSSEEGTASFIRNGKFINFRLPRNAVIFAWPAICTSKGIFIYKKENESLRNSEEINEIDSFDFCCIPVSVTSCCWLGYTLFAVEGNKVISIGIHNEKQNVLQLPNNMCLLSAVLPSQLIFVSTIPELSIVVEKRPLIFNIINDLEADPKFSALPYVLDHLPRSIPIDPTSLKITDKTALMSIFAKCNVSKITETVIDIYSRFGRFNELRVMVKNNKELSRIVANNAEKCGQFEVARQIYEELEDYESLFIIFMVSRSLENLKIMGKKYPFMRPALSYFNIKIDTTNSSQEDLNFVPITNVKLPKCKDLIKPKTFELAAGDESSEYSNIPLHMPAFDEPSDFGLHIYKLSSDEMQELQEQEQEQGNQTVATPPPVNQADSQNQSQQQNGENGENSNANGESATTENKPEVRQNPVHEFTEERLKFDDFFEEEDEMFKDEIKKPVLQFNFKPRKSLVPGAMANRFSLDASKPNLASDDTDVNVVRKPRASIQFKLDDSDSESSNKSERSPFGSNVATLSKQMADSPRKSRKSMMPGAFKGFQFNLDNNGQDNAAPPLPTIRVKSQSSMIDFPSFANTALGAAENDPNEKNSDSDSNQASNASNEYKSNMFMDVNV